MAVSTFHLGFILCVAFCSATFHLMIVIGNPDLSEQETRDSWLRQMRFLQAFMFVPLAGYFMTHLAEPNISVWFFVTVLASVALFAPPEVAVRKAAPANPAETRRQEFIRALRGAHAQQPKTETQPANVRPHANPEAVAETHVRILLGNFALGILMGVAILAPLIVAMLVVAGLRQSGLVDATTAQNIARFVPGVCSLLVPIAMPMSFLMFGPWVLRTTQRARSLLEIEPWRAKWDLLVSRSKELGYKNIERIRLFELPWEQSNFRNAFFIGWASRFNPFFSGIFLTKGIDQVLNENEIQFVISHEVAHGLSRHGFRRMTLGLGCFSFFVATQVISILMRAPMLSFSLAFVSLFWGYFLLRRQAEIQEFEADIIAMNLQGGRESDLHAATSALRKLNDFNRAANQGTGDPLIERRIASLQAIFGGQINRGHSDNDRKAA